MRPTTPDSAERWGRYPLAPEWQRHRRGYSNSDKGRSADVRSPRYVLLSYPQMRPTGVTDIPVRRTLACMPTNPSHWADTAAEAIRALNHATVPVADELDGPADVYDILGSLGQLGARLTQVLDQLAGFLDRELLAGRVIIVDGQHVGDPVTVVADATHALAVATDAAELFREMIDKAQSVLTWAAGSRTAGA